MADPKTQSPELSPDALRWWLLRGTYRFSIQNAMNGTTVPVVPVPSGGGGDCGPIGSYPCNNLNEGFTNVDAFDPEREAGAWPPTTELETQIAEAFTKKKPASTTIPLQLQDNTLESYRRQLLHKKWRRCQHLQAVNASLVNEYTNQQELQKLLLGQQVGNSGPTAA